MVRASEDLKSSTKEAQRLSAIAEVSKDNKNFFKYYRNDKRIANEIAKHFGYEDAKTLHEVMVEHYGDDNIAGISEKDIDTRASKVVDQKLAKTALSSFIKEKKMGKEMEKEFMEEFNDLLGGREMSEELVEKYTKKARTLLRNTPKFMEKYANTQEELRGAGVIGANSRGSNPIYGQKKASARLQDNFKKKS